MDQDETWHGGRPRPRPQLDGDPVPPKGQSPLQFSVRLLWPNGWMDQDATWYGVSPPRRHCIRRGPSSSPENRWHSSPTHQPMYCSETAIWIKMPLGTEVGLDPGHIALETQFMSPQKHGATAHPPDFRPIFVVAKRLDGSRCHLV